VAPGNFNPLVQDSTPWRPTSGSFRVSVYAGTDPLTGRQIRLRKTCKTERAAQIELGRLLEQSAAGRQPETDATVAQLMDRYAEVADWDLSTRKANEVYTRRVIKPTLGYLQVRRIRGPQYWRCTCGWSRSPAHAEVICARCRSVMLTWPTVSSILLSITSWSAASGFGRTPRRTRTIGDRLTRPLRHPDCRATAPDAEGSCPGEADQCGEAPGDSRDRLVRFRHAGGQRSDEQQHGDAQSGAKLRSGVDVNVPDEVVDRGLSRSLPDNCRHRNQA
jgi:hypothetical protein